MILLYTRMALLRDYMDEIESELSKNEEDADFVNPRLDYLTYHITAVLNEFDELRKQRVAGGEDILKNL